MPTKTIRSTDQIAAALLWAGQAARKGLEGGKPIVLTVAHETRKVVLNDLMWVKLTDMQNQAEHNGQKYSKEGWKMLCLAAFRNEQKREQRWIIGLDGQPVEDRGTSTMTNAEISDFIEWIQAYGTEEKGVKWTAPKRYE